MTDQPELTDAEKLAAAEAAMLAATEAAKAARLPSAEAAVQLLNSEEGMAFLASLKAAVGSSIDDLARVPQAGTEGTKQTLQRIVTSMEMGQASAAARLAALQPASVMPETPAEPEA